MVDDRHCNKEVDEDYIERLLPVRPPSRSARTGYMSTTDEYGIVVILALLSYANNNVNIVNIHKIRFLKTLPLSLRATITYQGRHS